jgi:hypothetical protein
MLPELVVGDEAVVSWRELDGVLHVDSPAIIENKITDVENHTGGVLAVHLVVHFRGVF